jgi:hypothetical protein
LKREGEKRKRPGSRKGGGEEGRKEKFLSSHGSNGAIVQSICVFRERERERSRELTHKMKLISLIC